jgi:uncharacterized protein YhaN
MAAAARRGALEAAAADRERQLTIRLGSGVEAEALRAELAAGRSQEWRRSLDSLSAELESIQATRDRALREQRDAETRLRALEESAELAGLEGERLRVLTELEAAAHRWRVLVTAQGLIERTLQEFERTRQPEVLAEASKMFATVTGGRFRRLSQAEREGEVVIFDGADAPLRIDELSRGTAEQLYVCIRLGLAAEFARRTVSLPLVMDDVLVNFDPSRARAMARVLVDFASGRQVLFFTCHPSTRDLLAGVDEGVGVVEMPAVAASSPG